MRKTFVNVHSAADYCFKADLKNGEPILLRFLLIVTNGPTTHTMKNMAV